MAFQVNIFLLLFGVIQGFLVSIALLRKKDRHPSHVFLTLFLVVVGLQLTFKVVTKMWLMDNVHLFYILSYYLPFLAAPAFYLFIRSRVNGTRFTQKDLLHIAPFVIFGTLTFLYSLGFRGYFSKPTIPWVRAVCELISLAAYFWYSRKLILSASGDSKRTLKEFLYYVTIAEAIVIITFGVMVMYYYKMPDLRMLFIVLTFVIYWITWKLMTDPTALLSTKTVAHAMHIQPVARYAHSGLKEEEASRIEQELRNLMSVQKAFTDSQLTIDKLAASVHTTRHHLSQVLNERIKRSYGDYISDLRLEEAKRRLADPKSGRYTIAAIALDSGFSAVSTFNESFKKRFGLTPSRFREDVLKKMSA